MAGTGSLRARWAAVGAAVAISLGAGGLGIVRATQPAGATAFVPVTPCRLFDTRPDFQVGARGTPLGPDDVHTVTAAGTCGIPSGATGVTLNVTAVGATDPTYLTVWPAGAERPIASNLNPSPGAPPTPNAVTTGLGAGGEFSVYNLAGSVDVLADVVGYYTDHAHDDRYYTKAQVDAAVPDAVTDLLTLATASAAQAVNAAFNLASVRADCPAGSHPVGGVGTTSGPATFHIQASRPTSDGVGWQVQFVTDDQAAAGAGNSVSATVECSTLAVHETVAAPRPVDPGQANATASATCPAGRRAVGGGMSGAGDTASWLLTDSYPAPDGRAWTVELAAEQLSFAPTAEPPASVTVYAICSRAST